MLHLHRVPLPLGLLLRLQVLLPQREQVAHHPLGSRLLAAAKLQHYLGHRVIPQRGLHVFGAAWKLIEHQSSSVEQPVEVIQQALLAHPGRQVATLAPVTADERLHGPRVAVVPLVVEIVGQLDRFQQTFSPVRHDYRVFVGDGWHRARFHIGGEAVEIIHVNEAALTRQRVRQRAPPAPGWADHAHAEGWQGGQRFPQGKIESRRVAQEFLEGSVVGAVVYLVHENGGELFLPSPEHVVPHQRDRAVIGRVAETEIAALLLLPCRHLLSLPLHLLLLLFLFLHVHGHVGHAHVLGQKFLPLLLLLGHDPSFVRVTILDPLDRVGERVDEFPDVAGDQRLATVGDHLLHRLPIEVKLLHAPYVFEQSFLVLLLLVFLLLLLFSRTIERLVFNLEDVAPLGRKVIVGLLVD